MVIVQDVKLRQPDAAFGAVKGPLRLKNARWIPVTLLTLLTVAAIAWFSTTPGWNADASPFAVNSAWSGLVIFLAVPVTIAYLIYTSMSFTHPQRDFVQDAYDGQTLWADSALRPWLQETYGIRVDFRQAMSLFNSHYAWFNHETADGRTEYVKTYLDNIYRLRNVVALGLSDSVGEVPDVEDLDLRLMIVEEPAKPRVYEWK